MNVRKIREEKGIKQAEIANILGVSVPSYSKKESGEVRFSIIEAKELATYFDMPIETIFFAD